MRVVCIASLFLFVFSSPHAIAQKRSLSGRITGAEKGEPVSHAVVEVRETSQRTWTDEQGGFRLELNEPGLYTVLVRHLAYAPVERTLRLPDQSPDSIIIVLRTALIPSEEITVRSSRSSASAEGAAVPAAVVTADRLVSHPPVSVPDALQQVPGLALVRDGTWETGVALRGSGRSNIVAMIDNTRIETANDIAGALSLFNVHDLERVEAVKSPGTVLYGSGAVGGVVHMMTKRSSFTGAPSLAAESVTDLSSVNNSRGQYLALEGATDRLALRLSGGFRKAGDMMTPAGILENSQFRDFSLAGSMAVRTFGDQTLALSYQRGQAEDAGIPGGAPIAASATATYTLARRELVAVEYALPALSPALALLTFRVSRQAIDRNVEIVQSPAVTVTPHATHATVSAQVESTILPFAGDLLVAGIDAWQRDLDSRRERRISSSGQVVGERPVPRSRFFSGGVFAQNTWNIVPELLTFTSGVRYDWIRIANDETFNPEYLVRGGVIDPSPQNRLLLWPASREINSSWSAAAGLEYRFLPAWTISCLASTAFRSPSLEERYQYLDLGTIVYLGNPWLSPERSVTMNAGLAASSGGWNMRADVFLSSFRELVAQIPGTFEGRSAMVNANIGRARISGGELSVDRRLSTWAGARATLAYARGEDLLTHAALPQIAPLQGELELSGSWLKVGLCRVVCSWAASQEHVAPGESRTPGYAVVNAGVESSAWDLGGVVLLLRSGVQNMLNREYRNHLSTLRGAVRAEPGREFYLSITFTR